MVTKLFLPPGHSSFGCRQCHDLSYRSVQQHDSRVDKLVKNPLLVPLAPRSPKLILMFLGLKAYVKWCSALTEKLSVQECGDCMAHPLIALGKLNVNIS